MRQVGNVMGQIGNLIDGKDILWDIKFNILKTVIDKPKELGHV